jgi:hypothetical protein
MIGVRYWSTGIMLKPDRWPRPDKWTASLTFLDNGFCEDDSTEGTLRLRYFVADLPLGLATLKQDAERLGIEWDNASGGPTVYVVQDGELDSGDAPELRAFADNMAWSLGWEPCYDREIPA